MPRTISEIALEIEQKWKNISIYAQPYVNAMKWLNTIHDNFGYDSGRSIVLYFLSNSNVWRGEDARRIKAELKELLK